MLRVPLSEIVLKIKTFENCCTKNPIKILSMAIDPPALSDIEAAILDLKMVI